MSWVRGFFGSTIGRKIVMAVSGIVLFGFVLGHMTGNMLIYKGPEAINAYGAGLRKLGALLWAVRLGLFTAAFVHIWAAVSLTRTSLAARPIGYQQLSPRESTYSSRTMRWSGVLLLLFIVYHIMHFTIGGAHPDFVEGDVYHNVIAGFRVWPASAFYILAMLALGMHLYHGVWSLLQTLGVNHPRYNRLRNAFAAVFALILVVGNISVPVAVLAGFIR
jgi:succinate dehydrogenase / fumarate reductase cytochrome b subunit